jgi:glycosyltransferase involved in cell wall biosynthesis
MTTEAPISPLRELWRTAPQPLRALVNNGMTAGARRVGQIRGLMERGPASGAPVCVMGLHQSVLGLGRGARLFQSALVEAGIETTTWDVSELLGDDTTIAAQIDDLSQSVTVVAHLNPIEHLHALAISKVKRPKRGFRVGYWAWETTQVPDNWIDGIAAVDEIWCPSVFTANAVRARIGPRRPIQVVSHPISGIALDKADKARFGLSEDKVTLFVACDMRSSVARKNPLGAIEAFKRSRCGDRGAAELLVKVHGRLDGDSEAERQLMAAAAVVPGVTIMNARLDIQAMRALRASVDIVFSPHRSEGFGLILAEAMAAGKPVIATAWSGNMDFMDARCAALIQSKVIPVDDPSGIYKTGNWAEPDLDHAASLIEKLVFDAEERARLGDAGARRIFAYANREDWNKRVSRLLNQS